MIINQYYILVFCIWICIISLFILVIIQINDLKKRFEILEKYQNEVWDLMKYKDNNKQDTTLYNQILPRNLIADED